MSVTVEEILSAFRRLYPSTNIVPGSLHIRQITTNALISTKPSTLAPEISKTTEFYPTKSPPRRCTPVRLNLCKSILEYNLTSYPNHFGHNNLDEIHDDLITFRLVNGLIYNMCTNARYTKLLNENYVFIEFLSIEIKNMNIIQVLKNNQITPFSSSPFPYMSYLHYKIPLTTCIR